MWVTVDKKGISIAPINMGGVLPWEEVTTADLKFIDKIEFFGTAFENPVFVNQDLTVPDTEVAVILKNLSPDFALEDTAHWKIPNRWSLEPVSSQIKIEPGGSTILRVRVKNEGKLYPVPTLILNFPYSKGKSYEIKKPLR
ncbi:unnamed protein product, partial [marine sediment metagenome]